MSELRSDPDALAVFDGHSISYTYENGWSFTNYFEGELRISEMKGKTLREEVTITETAPKVYFIAWEDAHMGLIAQVVNLNDDTVQAAVKESGTVQIWKAAITNFE